MTHRPVTGTVESYRQLVPENCLVCRRPNHYIFHWDRDDGKVTTVEKLRESVQELEQERARLLTENALLDEEVKQLHAYIDSHLGRSA